MTIIERLRALAGRATRGTITLRTGLGPCVRDLNGEWRAIEPTRHDWVFWSALSPDVVEALLDVVTAADFVPMYPCQHKPHVEGCWRCALTRALARLNSMEKEG